MNKWSSLFSLLANVPKVFFTLAFVAASFISSTPSLSRSRGCDLYPQDILLMSAAGLFPSDIIGYMFPFGMLYLLTKVWYIKEQSFQ